MQMNGGTIENLIEIWSLLNLSKGCVAVSGRSFRGVWSVGFLGMFYKSHSWLVILELILVMIKNKYEDDGDENEDDSDENEDEEKANRSQVSWVLELSMRSTHTSYKCSN